jgi:signal transduction histidine kinase
MSTPLHVLLVEDSETDAALILRHLNMADYDVVQKRVESAGQMQAALEQVDWDVVIADYKLPGFDAPAALAVLQRTGLDLPFVVVSGQIGEETAVALVKAGAHDYLKKDQLARLPPVVERELGEARMRRERRRGAEELRLSVEELARSNAELEQFAYVVSHDLQEPLRMVASYVQLLEQCCKDRLDSNAHEFIAYAVDGATRMKQMIADLLVYSRVGKSRREVVAVACEAALNRACADLRACILESVAEISHGPLPTVAGDAAQFAHLFQNLIGNAIKFRGQAPPRIHVSAEQNGEEWIFSVRDNGIGLDQKFADRIFMVFQRLHGREDYPGTGIGLAIARKIVEHRGGRIWVESEPGKGATFRFTVPLRHPDEKPQPETATARDRDPDPAPEASPCGASATP